MIYKPAEPAHLSDKAESDPDQQQLFVAHGEQSPHEGEYSERKGLAYGVERVHNKCVVPSLEGRRTYIDKPILPFPKPTVKPTRKNPEENTNIDLFASRPTSKLGRLTTLKYDYRLNIIYESPLTPTWGSLSLNHSPTAPKN